MQIATTKKQIQDFFKQNLNETIAKTVGFVPTMGALHNGHLELIKKAKKENDLVVCSIFVNPTQFTNQEDLLKYPKQEKEDIQKLEEINCDLLFLPEVKEIYEDFELKNPGLIANQTLTPDQISQTEETFESEKNQTFYEKFLFNTLEGEFRKGHYEGVCQVVKKLFEIIKPTKAYFGKKDYQQQLIIQKMTSFYGLQIQIIPCQTVREKSGLALSSRNQRLSFEQKELSQNIFKSLKKLQIQALEIQSIQQIQAQIETQISFLNSIEDFKVEYLKMRNRRNLQQIQNLQDLKEAIFLIAVYVDKVRLIDNLEVDEG